VSQGENTGTIKQFSTVQKAFTHRKIKLYAASPCKQSVAGVQH